MKPHFYLFVAAIIIVIIVAGALIASSGAPATKKGTVPGQVTVTINKAIGIDQISINNLDDDTGDFVKTFIQLPYSFNCSAGDAIELGGIAKDGYTWNGWQFSTGRFTTGTHITIISNDEMYALGNSVTITPECFKPATPYPTIAPTPTPIE